MSGHQSEARAEVLGDVDELFVGGSRQADVLGAIQAPRRPAFAWNFEILVKISETWLGHEFA